MQTLGISLTRFYLHGLTSTNHTFKASYLTLRERLIRHFVNMPRIQRCQCMPPASSPFTLFARQRLSHKLSFPLLPLPLFPSSLPLTTTNPSLVLQASSFSPLIIACSTLYSILHCQRLVTESSFVSKTLTSWCLRAHAL